MASFAPQGDIQVPQDESFRSRPLSPDRSLADLFGTAKDAVGGAVSYLYNSAKEDIWNQADAAVTGINEGQPGVANALNRTGNDNLNQILSSNPTLASAHSDLIKNKVALDQGVMDRSMYWAKMTIAAKELRSKYPGWGQDISEMFNNLTGIHTLEGHLNTAVEAENSSRGDKLDKIDQVRWATFQQLRNDMMLNPDTAKVAQGILSGDIPINSSVATQALGATSAWRGQKDSIGLKLQELDLDAKQGKNISEKASNTYAVDTGNMVTNAIQSVPPFSNGKSVLDVLGNMKPDDPNAIPMISQFGSWLGVQRASLASRFAQNRNNYRSLNMTDSQFSEIEKSELQPIDDLISLTGGKDPTLLAAAANQWKATVDNQAVIMTKNSPTLLRMAVAGKISPEFATYLNLHDPKIGATITGLINGDTVDHSTDLLNADKASNPNNTSRLMGQSIGGAVDLISRYQINGPEAVNFIKNNLTVERPGMDKYFQNLTDTGKQQFFETVTRPIFQEAVLKADKESPGLAQTYAAWVNSKLRSLPAVSTVHDLVLESMNGNRDSKINYDYDPMKGGFYMVPPRTSPSGFANGGMSQGQMMNAQDNISKFNVALNNMQSLYEKMGLDPKVETKRFIGDLFNTKTGHQ